MPKSVIVRNSVIILFLLSELVFKFVLLKILVDVGSDEGLYAWVVANHALGTLGGDPVQTTGIIELGGASAQVTFVSSEPVPPEFSRAVKFGNVTYNLYSHSFLHFGQNVAYDSLKEGIVSGDFDSGKDTSFAFFTDYMNALNLGNYLIRTL
ncbi:hypothetical protein TB2_013896 [Malus domestica]